MRRCFTSYFQRQSKEERFVLHAMAARIDDRLKQCDQAVSGVIAGRSHRLVTLPQLNLLFGPGHCRRDGRFSLKIAVKVGRGHSTIVSQFLHRGLGVAETLEPGTGHRDYFGGHGPLT